MQGKVVVITGASRGIGAEAARAFAAAGARVALLARCIGGCLAVVTRAGLRRFRRGTVRIFLRIIRRAIFLRKIGSTVCVAVGEVLQKLLFRDFSQKNWQL